MTGLDADAAGLQEYGRQRAERSGAVPLMSQAHWNQVMDETVGLSLDLR